MWYSQCETMRSNKSAVDLTTPSMLLKFVVGSVSGPKSFRRSRDTGSEWAKKFSPECSNMPKLKTVLNVLGSYPTCLHISSQRTYLKIFRWPIRIVLPAKLLNFTCVR